MKLPPAKVRTWPVAGISLLRIEDVTLQLAEAGVELSAQTSEKTATGLHSLAQTYAHSADADLDTVVEAWPSLHRSTRERIAAIVQGEKKAAKTRLPHTRVQARKYGNTNPMEGQKSANKPKKSEFGSGTNCRT